MIYPWIRQRNQRDTLRAPETKKVYLQVSMTRPESLTDHTANQKAELGYQDLIFCLLQTHKHVLPMARCLELPYPIEVIWYYCPSANTLSNAAIGAKAVSEKRALKT